MMPRIVGAERLAVINDKYQTALKRDPTSRISLDDAGFLLGIINNLPTGVLIEAWHRPPVPGMPPAATEEE